MKKSAVLFLALSVVFVSLFSISVYAEDDYCTNSIEVYGIKVTATTDKASYKVGEEINLTVTAQNNTDSDIYIYRASYYHKNPYPTDAGFFSVNEKGCVEEGFVTCEPMYNITTLKSGESITEPFKLTKDESDGFSLDITFSYLLEEKYAENDHHVILKLDNTMLSDSNNSSTSGNASTSGDAQPADVQLEVTEVGSVGESLVIDDTTKLYATIRNNGSEAGEAKVTVNFSVAGQTVDTQTYEVNLEPGKSTVVTSTKDWTADIGTWAVRADISQDGQPVAKARAAGQKYIKARISVAD